MQLSGERCQCPNNEDTKYCSKKISLLDIIGIYHGCCIFDLKVQGKDSNDLLISLISRNYVNSSSFDLTLMGGFSRFQMVILLLN
jgi:hypothetical protein